jgi:hypothetical protein
MRHVRRYNCVRDLRRKYTKTRSLDLAVAMLHGEPAGGVTRDTIEESYDDVRKDLERKGRKSEFFYLVAQGDEAMQPLRSRRGGDRRPNDQGG